MKKNMVVIAFLVLLIIYLFKYSLTDMISGILYHDYELQMYTADKKIEDFEYFHSNIVQSVPYLKEVEEIYGIDFRARKQYYYEEVKNTTTNIEYYGVMKAISKDLASFHTDICFPLYHNLKNLNCYASEDVLHQFGMKAKIEAWYREFEKEVRKFEDVDLFSVVYVGGHYVLREGWLSEDYKGMAHYELVSVNDMPAEEYVLQNLSIYSLHYDGLLNKPYREAFLFNGSIGEQVQVKWKTLTGEMYEQTLYVHKGVEVVASYGYLASERFEYYDATSEGPFFTYRDDENELEYVKINNFTNNKGKELKEYLGNVKYDKVVIDLRDNYGGLREYVKKYILLPLYASGGKLEWKWKVPNTHLNEKMTGLMAIKVKYYEDSDEHNYYYRDSLEFSGEAKKDRDVYYLVGPDTASAADWLVAVIKENGLGTIVGSNTGGEGLGASYICDDLPNTDLVYVYYPSVSTNSNCVKSSAYGTDPDVFVNQSVEDYIIFDKLRIEKKDNGYQSKLQYDPLLKWVIAQN